jgi:uncharacterized protein (TIGR02246 family)
MSARKRIAMGMSMAFVLVFASMAAAQEKAAPKASDVTAVRAAIDAANARFIAAVKAGDIPKVGAVYTADAVVLAPGSPAMKGRAAITELFNGWLSQMTVTDFSLTTDDLVVAGEYAFETGAFAMNMVLKSGGAAMPDKGKYIVVWKRDSDGSWKIHRDAWNADSAPPGAK